jgi:hypothetical protein
MATMKQIEANKRNAQRSTGPATAAGRDISRKNALKHGLTAREVTVNKAEEEWFDAFRADLVADLKPDGPLEETLVEEIAIYTLRLRRGYRFEANDSDDANPLSNLVRDRVVRDGVFGNDRVLSCASLIRYETSSARMRDRALHEFERLRARRRGEAVQAPLVVDVTHSMEGGSRVEHTLREVHPKDQ